MGVVLFQRIPRCLFEPFAVIALIGFCFWVYNHWKKDRAESVLFACTVIFMLAWRLMMPINADRYALIFIPPAIFFTGYAIEKIVEILRKKIIFPGPQLFLGVLLICCVVKTFHNKDEDSQMFEMVRYLKTEAQSADKQYILLTNYDLSVFLGDQFDVRMSDYRKVKTNASLKADYCLLKLPRKKMSQEAAVPGFTELKRIKHPNGKWIYVLWKRESAK